MDDNQNNEINPIEPRIDPNTQSNPESLETGHSPMGLVLNPISTELVVPDPIVVHTPEPTLSPSPIDPQTIQTVMTEQQSAPVSIAVSSNGNKKNMLLWVILIIIALVSIAVALIIGIAGRDQIADNSSTYTKNASLIASGFGHTCTIALNKNIYCWGQNTFGQLGNNTETKSQTPVLVDTSGVLNRKTAKSIVSGNGNYNCVIASDDQAYCWGDNYYGQLGNNSNDNSKVPVPVDASGVLYGKTIKSITIGSAHTCVIASDDNAYCWGEGGSGQLGNNLSKQSLTPVAVSTDGVLKGKTIKSISAGSSFTCAIASDEQLYCWGYNGYGQLGDGSITMSPVPVAVKTDGVLSGKTIKSVANGNRHTCVIASDNQVYCWGFNNAGQLGDDSTLQRLVPVAVNQVGALSSNVYVDIKANYIGTCAITSDARIYCWGASIYDTFGAYSSGVSSIPIEINTKEAFGGKTVKAISVGTINICAIASDDKVYCWGYNRNGALGNNSTTDSTTPVPVVGLP